MSFFCPCERCCGEPPEGIDDDDEPDEETKRRIADDLDDRAEARDLARRDRDER